jgi:hypothetical protein
MKAKRLKGIVNSIDDDFDIFIRNSVNPCGSIQQLEQVEVSTYGFFGKDIPCLILNTDNAKKIETNEEGESIDLIGKEK